MPLMDEVLAHGELQVEAGALEDDAEPAADLPRLAWRDRRRRPGPCRAPARARVARMRNRVVLPPPLGPRKPKTSPAATWKSTPASAGGARRPAAAALGGIGVPHAARLDGRRAAAPGLPGHCPRRPPGRAA